MWDFVMDKSCAGAGFLGKLWFPLPIYIPSASSQSSSLSPEAGTIGQEWPQCQQPHKPEFKKNKSIFTKVNQRNLPRARSIHSIRYFSKIFSSIPLKIDYFLTDSNGKASPMEK
jgi:hypothetical protein